MTLGTGLTILGLVNSSIGSTMLVLPILALNAGYLDWSISCLILAVVTCYTAYLMVKHLGKAKNIKYLILYHFGMDKKYTTAYNIIIWCSFAFSMIIYFNLFCSQLRGLFEQMPFVQEILMIFLILWTIWLRQYDLTEIALASGIASIICYIFYLFWVVESAPSGQKSLPATSSGSSMLILTLLNSFTIHDFMIQVITVNPARGDYPKIVIWVYVICTIMYIFLCYSSTGLINRKSAAKNPQSIVDFFEGSDEQGWSLDCVQIIFIFHILTTFPEYMVVSKIRILQLFSIEHDPQSNITTSQVIYFICMIVICYLVKKLQISLTFILNVSGAVIGYLFSMFIPIFIHLKCIHYDHSSGYIQDYDSRNLAILSNQCQCNIIYKSKTYLWIETFTLLFIDIFAGIYFMSTLASEMIKELNPEKINGVGDSVTRLLQTLSN